MIIPSILYYILQQYNYAIIELKLFHWVTKSNKKFEVFQSDKLSELNLKSKIKFFVSFFYSFQF